jgi:hypothetical protein
MRAPSTGHIARGHILKPRDHPQQRGLAAARGADKDAELAVLDMQIDALDDIGLAKGLGDLG